MAGPISPAARAPSSRAGGTGPLRQRMVIPRTAKHVGKQHRHVMISGGICYEVGSDVLVRSEVTAGANLLASQSNDADFELDGQLGESGQQAAMARIRAIESDRAVVYASTTGKAQSSRRTVPDRPQRDLAPQLTRRLPLTRSPRPVSALPGSLMVTWQMSCCRRSGPVHYLAMYQVARAGLRICMSR